MEKVIISGLAHGTSLSTVELFGRSGIDDSRLRCCLTPILVNRKLSSLRRHENRLSSIRTPGGRGSK